MTYATSTAHLVCQTRTGITLAKAIDAVAPKLDSAIGLCYTPTECYFARYDHDGLWHLRLLSCGQRLEEQPVSLDSCHGPYEVRLFDRKKELRWLCNPEDSERRGTAVVVGQDIDTDPFGGLGGKSQRHDIPISEELPSQYLLWGQCDSQRYELPSGWSCLWEPRIPPLWVPFAELPANKRLTLKLIEYIGRDPGLAGEHGNCSVVMERLTCLELAS